ncbi:MAG TPA: LysR family transcriptional regulator [Kofleriaceae bacterium]|jgi:DNA-binding transcriptional LysR family regulator|nr:LysR family transcriptional regulator [Kofleriaceae bacterium]
MRDNRESIQEMAALVTSVATGSFSRAAPRLGMTPSGVSKLVSRLERRLGVQLLQRTTRTMQLTDAGAFYHERAARLLEDIDGLERDLAGHHRHPRGRLRLTAPTVLGEALILPVIIAFQRRYPDVTIALELTDRVVDVVGEGFDVAIRLTARPPEAFVARRLGDDVRRLCASPGYLRKHRRPERPDDLARHRCITFVTPTGPSPWHLRRSPALADDGGGGGGADAGAIAPFVAKASLELNSTAAVHQAVLGGLGIADLPSYLVDDELATGRLVALLAPYVPVRRTIYAIHVASRLVPAKTRAFLHMLGASFQAGRATAVDDDA